VDQTISDFIKRVQGDSVILTGWVLVAATAEGAVAGAPLGFTMASSDGMPTYTKIGLLQSAVQSIENHNLFLSWENRKRGPNPPF
jgi:hypothetical protein